MTGYRDVRREDWVKTMLFILFSIAFMSASAVLLSSIVQPLGTVLSLILIGGTLFTLVRWHAKITAYRCTECRSVFEISMLMDLRSPHLPTKKLLRCPTCGRRGWAQILIKETN